MKVKTNVEWIKCLLTLGVKMYFICTMCVYACCPSCVCACVCVWAFYLRVGHASKAILRVSLRTPAADLLRHLLSSSCHPWMALWDASLHWPVTHTTTQSHRHTFNPCAFNKPPLVKCQQHPTHRLLTVSVVSGGGRALLSPGPPSWAEDSGSTRWNSNGVRFCVRYTT